MTQLPLNSAKARGQVVTQTTESVREHTSRPVIDGGPRQWSSAAKPPRSLLRRMAYALAHFIGYYPDVEPHIKRQWD